MVGNIHGSSPLNFRGHLKLSDPNNFALGQKIKFVGGGVGGGGQPLRGDLKFFFWGGGGGLPHFASQKLAEANLLLNIKKMLFYFSDAEF